MVAAAPVALTQGQQPTGIVRSGYDYVPGENTMAGPAAPTIVLTPFTCGHLSVPLAFPMGGRPGEITVLITAYLISYSLATRKQNSQIKVKITAHLYRCHYFLENK